MKLHKGELANPVKLVTKLRGYRYVQPDGSQSYIEHENTVVRAVKRIYGISTTRWFIGFIRYDVQPE